MSRPTSETSGSPAEAVSSFRAAARSATEGRRNGSARQHGPPTPVGSLLERAQDLLEELDPVRISEAAAALAVEELADLCTVDWAFDPEGPGRRAAAGSSAVSSASLRVLERSPASWDGRSLLQPEATTPVVVLLSESDLARIAPDAEQRATLEALRPRFAAILPLRASGRGLGTLSLLRLSPAQQFSPEELEAAAVLARFAGLALGSARAVEEATARARDAERALSVAAHELRSPLNVLYLQLEGLNRETALPERAVTAVETMWTQSRRLDRLVEGLGDVARSRHDSLALEDFDLVDLTREAIARQLGNPANSGAPFALRGRGPVCGSWDRLRIEQLLDNLLSNAAKYGRGAPIEVRVEREGELARLVVKDRGIGIPRDQLDRIFLPFERAAPGYGGIGLGLFIAREAVAAHGGAIRVESEPGRGSAFTIELPLRPIEAPSVAK